jgi:hypothetical protein
MIFREHAGLLLLGFIPLFLLVARSALRRRRIALASYFIVREIIDSLPVLPRSFLLRKKIQTYLLLAALCFLALSSGNPFLGSPAAEPVKVIIALDHLSQWKDPDGRPAGWSGVTGSARDLVRRLRRDDRILLVRTDTGPITRGFSSPSRAAAALRGLSPSQRPLHPEAALEHLSLLAGTYRPDTIAIVTTSPARWRKALAGKGNRWHIVQSPHPPPGPNISLVDVDIRPDLFRPGRLNLFCRIGAFDREDSAEELTVTLTISQKGTPLHREDLAIVPGESRGVIVQDLPAGAGLLNLRVEPSDWFPDDNVFTTPVRMRPFLETSLVTAGNHALESALRSIPGLSLTVTSPESAEEGRGGAVTIYDGFVPDRLEGNVLVMRPFESLPGLSFHGEADRPQIVAADEAHRLMKGVSFESLRLKRLPVFIPDPALSVVAKADGYPFLLAGESRAGGRLAVVGFDPVESGWIYDPSFPILIANLVSWLGEESSGTRSSFRVGDKIDGEFLQSLRSITDPEGREHRPPPGGGGSYTFRLAGEFRVEGRAGEDSGSIYVNLVNEEVSRRMVMAGTEPGDDSPPPLPARPFRLELKMLFLSFGIVLLLLEVLVEPSARVGRIPE